MMCQRTGDNPSVGVTSPLTTPPDVCAWPQLFPISLPRPHDPFSTQPHVLHQTPIWSGPAAHFSFCRVTCFHPAPNPSPSIHNLSCLWMAPTHPLLLSPSDRAIHQQNLSALDLPLWSHCLHEATTSPHTIKQFQCWGFVRGRGFVLRLSAVFGAPMSHGDRWGHVPEPRL